MKLNIFKKLTQKLTVLLLAFLVYSINTYAQNSEIENLKAQLNEGAKNREQVQILNKLGYILYRSNPAEAEKYSLKAEKIASEINDQKGLADAFSTLGNLQAFQFNRPDKASDYHNKAYRIYKSLYESNQITKWEIYDFLNDSALPAYKYAVEADSKKRKYKIAIKNYEKLNIEFTEYLTALATQTQTELNHTKKELGNTKNELGTTKSELGNTETKLHQTKSILSVKKQNELKLLADREQLYSSLEENQVKSLKLSDSLYDKEMELKINALNLLKEQANTEKLKKEKALQRAEMNKQKLINLFLIVVSVLGLVLIAFIYISLRNQRKTNRILNEQKEELALKNQEINKQKEEIEAQRDNIEHQNIELQQQKEETQTQRDNLEELAKQLQGQNEEIEAQRDNLSELNQIIAKERDKSDEILFNVLPKAIAEELKENGKAAPRYYDMATVLFTDFKGFTKIAEQLSPEQIIKELNYCFLAFDEIIDKYNALDTVKASLAMIEFMENFKAEKKAKGEQVWELRIGIHTGPVVAGVIGKNKFAYDIWGDTVNMASRMEASGEEGKVNISGTT